MATKTEIKTEDGFVYGWEVDGVRFASEWQADYYLASLTGEPFEAPIPGLEGGAGMKETAAPIQTEPITVGQYTLIDGQWVKTGTTPTPAPTVAPTEGDTRVNTDPAYPLGEYTFTGGQWVLSSPTATPTTPTTTAPTTGAANNYICPICGTQQDEWSYDGHVSAHKMTEAQEGFGEAFAGGVPPFEPLGMGSPWAKGTPQFMEEEYGRWPGFGTALGLFGRQSLTPHEQYLASMQGPLERLYDIGGRMGTAGGFGQYAPGGMFSEWAPQYAQNPFAMYGLAQGMMGDVMGMNPEQRATTNIGYETNPRAVEDLLSLGLRTQLGKGTAGWLSGKLPAERQSWLSQYPQQQGPSFMDYISQKYNLGQFF